MQEAFIVSKKVTDLQKKEILESFKDGLSLKDLSLKYKFSVQTISRQLKNLIGEAEFKKIKLSKLNKNDFNESISLVKKENQPSKFTKEKFENNIENEFRFVEIAPLTEGVNLETQKDISSKPLSEISLPKNLYLLVDKNTELEPRLLKDYSEWHFLPEEDLRRYTIEIFQEKKKAQYKCQKNQKLIKVPNPDVFLKASTILKSKGISRIVFENSLLAI